jgi:hypothetical protein
VVVLDDDDDDASDDEESESEEDSGDSEWNEECEEGSDVLNVMWFENEYDDDLPKGEWLLDLDETREELSRMEDLMGGGSGADLAKLAREYKSLVRHLRELREKDDIMFDWKGKKWLGREISKFTGMFMSEKEWNSMSVDLQDSIRVASISSF